MRRQVSLRMLLAAAVSIALVVVVVAIWSFPLQGLPPSASATFSISDLRSGTNFTLGGVRFVQTGFQDFQTGPIVDGGYFVSFRVAFPDGTSETVDFGFDGYCPAGSISQASTVHRSPAATFRHVCGEDFIRVSVLP